MYVCNHDDAKNYSTAILYVYTTLLMHIYVHYNICVVLLQTVSANSSHSDLYAAVDKTKKNSTPVFPTTSTRPVRIHDYEDIDDNSFPRKTPQPPQHYNEKSNNSVPPRIPPPYQGGGERHVNGVDGLKNASVDRCVHSGLLLE